MKAADIPMLRGPHPFPEPPVGNVGWPWIREGVGLAEEELAGPLPRISIVTPSLNQGKFIEQAIRSVLLQNYPDLEYIIIDGGSTDGTLEIIRNYAPWLSYWTTEKDRGQAHAINKGLAVASGQIVGWLNADDLLLPEALMAVGKAFVVYPEAGMIYGSGSEIEADGRIHKRIPYRAFDGNLLRTRYYMLQQSSFFRRSLLEEIGLLNETIQYFMDWELTLRVHRQAPIVGIPQEIGIFRIQPLAKTQTSGEDRLVELVLISRKYNGVLDKNVLAFVLKRICDRLGRRIGPRNRTLLWRSVSAGLDKLLGRDTYMIH